MSDEDLNLGKKFKQVAEQAEKVSDVMGKAITAASSITINEVAWEPMITTGTGTLRLPTSSTPPTLRRKQVHDMPPRVTGKVLIAFLEDDDSVVWAARLAATSFSISQDPLEAPVMMIELSLERAFE